MCLPAVSPAVLPVPADNSTIHAIAGASEIVIRTDARLAGAIGSLIWNGMEFINSRDHGRELQFAVNLDFGTPITGETFNPTEAGSRDDHLGTNTTSRLFKLSAETNDLRTTCKMAFWLAPGEKSYGSGRLAKNTTILSEHLLSKQVQIGYRDLPHAIAYNVTWTVPPGEHHTHADVEALTAYMPPEFSEFMRFNLKTGNVEPLTNKAVFISDPIIFSVPGGTYAMGIYAPPQPMPKTTGPTYGHFRFIKQKVVKWNCRFQIDDPKGLAPGEYSFCMFVIVGDLDIVRDSMQALQQKLGSNERGGL